MLPPANLLLTFDPAHEGAARANAFAVLQALGSEPRFLEVRQPGVFEVDLGLPARPLLQAARELCRRGPERFAHTHHWRPVDAWSAADPEALRRAATQLAPRITPRDAWRCTLAIHGASPWHQRDLLPALTDPVRGREVRLQDPDKELRVDVLGDRAALAVLARGEELSVDHEAGAGTLKPPEP